MAPWLLQVQQVQYLHLSAPPANGRTTNVTYGPPKFRTDCKPYPNSSTSPQPRTQGLTCGKGPGWGWSRDFTKIDWLRGRAEYQISCFHNKRYTSITRSGSEWSELYFVIFAIHGSKCLLIFVFFCLLFNYKLKHLKTILSTVKSTKLENRNPPWFQDVSYQIGQLTVRCYCFYISSISITNMPLDLLIVVCKCW
jgi:hypothetical protein